MPRLSSRYRHHAAAVIQCAITSAVASAIASPSDLSLGALLAYWFNAWLLAWLTLVPVVLVATPWIKRLAAIFVEDEPHRQRLGR